MAASRSRRKAAPSRWQVALPPDPAAAATAEELRRELRLSPVCARILARRGYTELSGAKAFLSRNLDLLHEPQLLPDMARAIARIAAAVEQGQRIVLFGDYDADGLTATALLSRFFQVVKSSERGAFTVEALVPERKHGYGLSAEAAAAIKRHKPDLLITLDNGISAHGPLDSLAQAGTDCIVVDHHHIGASLPRAVAVINPKRRDGDCNYPFTDLCGAGIAFKLAWALAVHFSHNRTVTKEFRAFLLDAVALAGIGTLADVVPLVGENRVLAHQGLLALRRTRASGLRALMKLCAVPATPRVSDVTFRIAPRLNAAGRCGEVSAALELLLTADATRAEDLATLLDGYNAERQDIEGRILEEARQQALDILTRKPDCCAFVLESADWHDGVIGIVASRIVEEFHRPALLLSVDATTKVARGSGRSIRGLHLSEALSRHKQQLLQFGGHAAAAGLSIAVENIEAFRTAFQHTAAAALKAADLQPTLHVEEQVTLSEVDAALCRDLEAFEPCGIGNPRPMLAACGVSISSPPQLMGREEAHLNFFVRQGSAKRRVVGFDAAEHFNTLCDLSRHGTVDIAFRPQVSKYDGSVELIMEAFRTGA